MNISINRLKNKSFVMYVFLAIQTIIFILTDIIGLVSPSVTNEIMNFGTMNRVAVLLNHEWWRFITPIFIHFGFAHFILNSVTLYFIGDQVERIFGHARFFIIYLLAGIAGNVMSFAFGNLNSISAGASTSLFGLFGTFLVLYKMFPHDYRVRQVAKQYGLFIVMNLVFNLFSSGVDMLGHIGGLVGGIMATVIVSVPKENQYKGNIHVRIITGIFFVVLAIVLVAYKFKQYQVPLF